MLAALRADRDGAAERRVRDELERRAGNEPEIPEVAQELGVAVGHARDRGPRSGLEVEQCAVIGVHDAQIPIRATGISLDQVFGAEMLAGGYRKKYLRATSRLIALTFD